MSDESLFREVDEEVRQEQFKKLWERYGNAVIVLCLLVVVAVAGFKGWQYWQLKQSQAAAEKFFEAAALVESGKTDEALTQFGAVAHSGYADLAKLREANLLAAQGKAADAVLIYDAVAADADTASTLRDLARIRAGYILTDTLKPSELESRIGSFNQPGNSWRHAAREIITISAWRTGDYVLANQTMNIILGDAETPQALRQRTEALSELVIPLLPAT